jgi:trehalose/maltose hydrolase-like predicted phosphorylase
VPSGEERRVVTRADEFLSAPAISSGTTSPFTDWHLVVEGFEPAREHDIESVFAIANGYIGTRASIAEDGPVSHPGTFIAGVFDRAAGSIAELVTAPDWARFDVVVAGESLRLDTGQILEHRRMLDLRRGLFLRFWRHRDRHGRVTRLFFTRFASLADRHSLVETVEVTPENYSGLVTVTATIDADSAVTPLIVQTELGAEPTPDGGSALTTTRGTPQLVARTQQPVIALAYAQATRIVGLPPERASIQPMVAPDCAGEAWTWEAILGETSRVEKHTSVFTSREVPDPADRARVHVTEQSARGADALRADHERNWSDCWDDCEITVAGDDALQNALRFALFHLNAAVNPGDDRVSVGARALTGDAYKGHVFWDTEIYMLPFYLYTRPEAARALLMYRYHTLPAARDKALANGFRGALYAWESADTGTEESPTVAVAPDGEVVPIFTGEMEHHISADVAYAVWHYWQATGDEDFLRGYGAEIILETARFWASRVSPANDGLFHIRQVIGPDEYHQGVDDNAYTNGLAAWNLRTAVRCAELFARQWPTSWAELAGRLDLHPNEILSWTRIADRLAILRDEQRGLIEQFEGYFALDDLRVAAFEPILAPLDMLLGRERVQRSQIIKQPDVVMLEYLLWDSRPPTERAADFQYYFDRCANGSSLSPSIQALVAARLGDQGRAATQLELAAQVDLENSFGNAAGGVHAAALGGLWQAVVCGFGGVRAGEDALVIEPRLLDRWDSLAFPVRWRGARLRISISRLEASIVVEHLGGPSVSIRIGGPNGTPTELRAGERHASIRDEGGWSEWKSVVG